MTFLSIPSDREIPGGFGFESSLAIPLALPVSLPSAFTVPGSVSFSQPDATEPAESHLTTSRVQEPLRRRPFSQVNGFQLRFKTISLLDSLSLSLFFSLAIFHRLDKSFFFFVKFTP